MIGLDREFSVHDIFYLYHLDWSCFLCVLFDHSVLCTAFGDYISGSYDCYQCVGVYDWVCFLLAVSEL
jgi:hypothetical protein